MMYIDATRRGLGMDLCALLRRCEFRSALEWLRQHDPPPRDHLPSLARFVDTEGCTPLSLLLQYPADNKKVDAYRTSIKEGVVSELMHELLDRAGFNKSARSSEDTVAACMMLNSLDNAGCSALGHSMLAAVLGLPEVFWDLFNRCRSHLQLDYPHTPGSRVTSLLPAGLGADMWGIALTLIRSGADVNAWRWLSDPACPAITFALRNETVLRAMLHPSRHLDLTVCIVDKHILKHALLWPEVPLPCLRLLLEEIPTGRLEWDPSLCLDHPIFADVPAERRDIAAKAIVQWRNFHISGRAQVSMCLVACDPPLPTVLHSIIFSYCNWQGH